MLSRCVRSLFVGFVSVMDKSYFHPRSFQFSFKPFELKSKLCVFQNQAYVGQNHWLQSSVSSLPKVKMRLLQSLPRCSYSMARSPQFAFMKVLELKNNLFVFQNHSCWSNLSASQYQVRLSPKRPLLYNEYNYLDL